MRNKKYTKTILSGSPFFAIHKNVLLCFGVENAIFITNLIDTAKYLSERELIRDGWFFHTHEQQIKKTTLSEYKIRLCKKYFIEKGILKTKKIGNPSKEWYNININLLEDIVQEFENENDIYHFMNYSKEELMEHEWELKRVQKSEKKGRRTRPTKIEGLKKKHKKNEVSDLRRSKVIRRTDTTSTTYGCRDIPSEYHHSDFFQKSQRNNSHGNNSGTQNTNSSMKEKLKNKLSKKEKKPKKKIQYETPQNIRIFEYWNKQPNLRTHRTGTKTYHDSLRRIHQLRSGALKIDNPKNNGIPKEWYSRKWKSKDIVQAIKILNKMYCEDYWPDNKKILPKSLPDAILNNNLTSWIMMAYKYGLKPKQDLTKDMHNFQKEGFEKLKDVLNSIRTKNIDPNEEKMVAQTTYDLFDIFMSVPFTDNSAHLFYAREKPKKGTIYGIEFVRAYVKYIQENFKSYKNMGPKALQVDSKIFNSFIHDWQYYHGVDIRTGEYYSG